MSIQSAPFGAVTPIAAPGGLAEGAEVLTLSGLKPVETLAPGDRVVTRGGARVLRGLSCRTVQGGSVRVSAQALGHDRPEADIVLSAGQQVLLRDWRARAMTGQDRALLPVGRLVDGEYIRAEAPGPQRLYTLHFDAPAVIYAQGLELACPQPAAG